MSTSPSDKAQKHALTSVAKQFSRRDFLKAAAGGVGMAVVGGSVLSGCAVQPTSAPTTAPAVTSAPTTAPAVIKPETFDWRRFADQTIKFVGGTYPENEYNKGRMSEFEELTGIKVKYELYPEDQYRQKVKVELLAESQDLDAFTTFSIQEGRQFLEAGWYQNLQGFVDDSSLTSPDFDWEDFQPTSRQQATFDGVLIAIPTFAPSMLGLYYRRDLFKQFGLERPKTWDDVWNAAKTIYEGTNGDVYGITLRGKGGAASSMVAIPLYDFGGSYFDPETGDVTLYSPEAVKAFTWWGDILRLYGPPGSANYHWAEVLATMQEGRAGMMFTSFTRWGALQDPKKSKVAGKVGAAPAPTGPASDKWRNAPPNKYTQQVIGTAVSGLSDSPEAAWLLTQFMHSKEAQKWLMKNAGYLSPRQSTWQDPEVIEGRDPEWIEVAEWSTTVIYPGHYPLSIVNAQQAREYIGNAVITAIEGGDVDAALKLADQQLKDLLEKERAQRSS